MSIIWKILLEKRKKKKKKGGKERKIWIGKGKNKKKIKKS